MIVVASPLRRLLLLLLLLWASPSPRSRYQVSAVNLRRFIGCAVREFTFLARKPGCKGMHVTTDACWGRCETWEVRQRLYCTHTHTHRRGNVITLRGDV